jgi:hypothetical protein
MTVKTLVHPTTGQTFRLGRKLAPARPRRLARFARFSSAASPIPASTGYTAYPAGSSGDAWFKNVLGNDKLGDCTCAGALHVAGAWFANVGEDVPFNPDDAIALYERACGYDPADPSTDQGGNEQDVLTAIQMYGLEPDGSHKIAGFCAVDGSNLDEVHRAIYELENVYFGLALPDAWINPFPAGDGATWDVAGDPDPSNGHCVVGLDYRADGAVLIITWGLRVWLTPAAIAKYAVPAAQGEVYALWSEDALSRATAKSAGGFDAAGLKAAFAALQGAA